MWVISLGMDVKGAFAASGVFAEMSLKDLRKTRSDYNDVLHFFNSCKGKGMVKPSVKPYVDGFIVQFQDLNKSLSVLIDEREK